MSRAKSAILSVLGTAVVATAAVWSPTASASQVFYDQIAAQTGTCSDCRLCHSSPVGSLETLDLANKPFALSWYTKGKPLPLPMDGTDSDGDGVSDLDELMGEGNPNDAMVGLGQFECPTGPLPEYGCVARVAPEAPGHDGWALALSLLPALLLLRRRN